VDVKTVRLLEEPSRTPKVWPTAVLLLALRAAGGISFYQGDVAAQPRSCRSSRNTRLRDLIKLMHIKDSNGNSYRDSQDDELRRKL
jgi:hypothetical protein